MLLQQRKQRIHGMKWSCEAHDFSCRRLAAMKQRQFQGLDRCLPPGKEIDQPAQRIPQSLIEISDLLDFLLEPEGYPEAAPRAMIGAHLRCPTRRLFELKQEIRSDTPRQAIAR